MCPRYIKKVIAESSLKESDSLIFAGLFKGAGKLNQSCSSVHFEVPIITSVGNHNTILVCCLLFHHVNFHEG